MAQKSTNILCFEVHILQNEFVPKKIVERVSPVYSLQLIIFSKWVDLGSRFSVLCTSSKLLERSTTRRPNERPGGQYS